MARIRHLLLALAFGAIFHSSPLAALGLGEISLQSALHQPLRAEIELLEIGDLAADEIKVRLASAEDFNRVGVERLHFLNDLRFTPFLSQGRNLIRVVSAKPVREPYLNFIIEVARPGGSLLREYTVLIDPPGLAAIGSPMPPEPVSSIAASAPPQQAAPARPLPPASRGERYRVQRGDSLWTIAGRLQAAGSAASREALMADIHALNPAAFAGGDRNRLRAEAELLLPDAALAGPAGVATPAQAEGSEVEAPNAEVQSTQSQMDTELAGVTAQNLELRKAVNDLQGQLAQLQAQMAEKDRQLQQIRDDLQQRHAAPAADTTAPATEHSWGWTLWLVGALLLLLLGAWLLVRRRTPRAPASQQAPLAETSPAVRASQPPPTSFEPEMDDEIEAQAIMPAALAPPRRLPTGAADPLEGANIYIAYGRFGAAANALRKAVEQHPERLDLRLRLFEVYGELGDAGAFFEQERQLRELGASPVQLEQIRARYAALQRPSQDAFDDLVLQLDEPVPDAPAPDEFQLNLDDLSLDADWGLVSPFQPERVTRSRGAKEQDDEGYFHSNLTELPEVLEMEVLESFAELPQERVLEDRPLHSDLEHLAGSREHLAKLNMALAYIEQGDIPSACDILNEVISEGDEEERERARELLAKIA